MVVKMSNKELDSFEKNIENNAEDFIKVSKKTERRVSNIIAKANEKNRITLRLSNQTLNLIKQKAQEEGLPYQTYISSILYKYATDKLLDEKQILKSIQLLNK